MLYTDGANALAVVAVVVVRVDIAGIEVQVVSVVAIARIERTRPIVAVATCIVEARIVAITGSRQKPEIIRQSSDENVSQNSRTKPCEH